MIKEKGKLNSRHIFFHQRKDIMNKWIKELINAIAFAANPIPEEKEDYDSISDDEQSNRLMRTKSSENILGVFRGTSQPKLNKRSAFQSCSDLNTKGIADRYKTHINKKYLNF